MVIFESFKLLMERCSTESREMHSVRWVKHDAWKLEDPPFFVASRGIMVIGGISSERADGTIHFLKGNGSYLNIAGK